ncbi:hypothetical protein ACFQ22_12405 [Lentilactobacillus raoultii]|uniref:Uncharacterized protein n=1 Tax=Lentilactobacillus raoultii TaxID=1987503 RepID=A0ABW3PJG8_9LACO|nr:hypothetical protein [Lentilactobacillus raoultii]
MQNNQSYLTEIRKTVKQNYRQFFALDKHKPLCRNCQQMPEFQIQLFIDRAITAKFPIRICFNNEAPAMSGILTRLSDGRYLLTNSREHLLRILNIVEIQSIQRLA